MIHAYNTFQTKHFCNIAKRLASCVLCLRRRLRTCPKRRVAFIGSSHSPFAFSVQRSCDCSSNPLHPSLRAKTCTTPTSITPPHHTIPISTSQTPSLRRRTPPPHVTEHAFHCDSSQAASTQSSGQFAALHCCERSSAGQALPPCAGNVSIARVL